MISDRLHQIALFIDYQDAVIDIGCDHALLDIFVAKNNLCRHILASDINENALKSGQDNIKSANLEKEIPTVLSDGLNKINTLEYNTVIISGMGAHTILHILNNKKKLSNIQKIIIQSNNDYNFIRKLLNKIGYYLEDEAIVYDKNHYYSVMKFVKGKLKNKSKIIKYGILKISNINYYEFIIKKNNEIIEQLNHHWLKKWQLKKINRFYLRYIKRIIGRKLVDY